MKHGDKVKNLSRTASHRKALLSNLAINLIEHKRIVTTFAKAKALRVYIEPLLTKSKKNITHNRRVIFSHLQNKSSIEELFTTIAEKIMSRPGGYTRVIKLGTRSGDNAELALIELVDFNTIYKAPVVEVAAESADEPAKKTRRGKTKKETPAATDTVDLFAAPTA